MWVQSLGWGDPLEEEMATHSNILAWKIPCTEDPGGQQSMAENSQTRPSMYTHVHTHSEAQCRAPHTTSTQYMWSRGRLTVQASRHLDVETWAVESSNGWAGLSKFLPFSASVSSSGGRDRRRQNFQANSKMNPRGNIPQLPEKRPASLKH